MYKFVWNDVRFTYAYLLHKIGKCCVFPIFFIFVVVAKYVCKTGQNKTTEKEHNKKEYTIDEREKFHTN